METLKRKLGEDDPAGFLCKPCAYMSRQERRLILKVVNSFCAGDKESRNKGVERAFLDWAVEHAKSAGVTTFADLMERKSGGSHLHILLVRFNLMHHLPTAGSSLWTDHGFKECGDPIVVGGGKFKVCRVRTICRSR